MKKQAKKRPRPFKPGKAAAPTRMPEGSPSDKEMSAEGSTADEKADIRQAVRKSRPSVI